MICNTPDAQLGDFTVRNVYFDTEVLKVIDIRMNRGTAHPLVIR